MLTNKQYIGILGIIAAVSIVGLWLDRNTSTDDVLVGEEHRRLLAAGSLTELQEPPPVSIIHLILYYTARIYILLYMYLFEPHLKHLIISCIICNSPHINLLATLDVSNGDYT